jgi:phage terminase small subunit
MALTPKQARFVQEYLIDMNATQAALRCNYSEKSAYSQGQRLLKNDKVRAAIDKKREQQEIQSDISRQKILDKLWKMVESNEEDAEMISIKAIEVIIKMQGYNEPERTEVTIKQEPPIFSDDDSLEE